MAILTARRWGIVVCVLVGTTGLAFAAMQQVARPVRISTTSPELALSNLESQITTLVTHPELVEGKFDYRRQLFGLLSLRTQYLGKFSDFSSMEKLTKTAPVSLDEHLLRAKYLTAVHQFDDALAVLDAAEAIAPGNQEAIRARISIKLARRERLPELQNIMTQALAKNRSYSNLVLAAGVESELGNFKQADDLFAEAISSFKDSSPFPLAFLFFQRGLMWSEKAGDAKLGRLYYEEAVHYLPQFVVARVHLAEILREEGEREPAIEMLSFVTRAEDPEPRGVLAELLHEKGQESESVKLIAEAKAIYDELLLQYPLAFADHGAEFFAGPGHEPARALELARRNLANRPSERSYQVAIEAAQAAGNNTEICSLVRAAQALPPTHVPLRSVVAAAQERCQLHSSPE